MKPFTRILLGIGAVLLIAANFVPMWRIELVAPQYPEGLELVIESKGLSGNVEIINGLNHYIGMKTLHNEDFPEFRILPYLLYLFAAGFILVAISGKLKHLKILLVSFIIFGVVAMADFWHWEYQYGHDLDPNAAIKVPGMAYQPPLIGYKQLLNFAAYSMPAAGGWFILGAGVLLVACLISETRFNKHIMKTSTAVASFFLLCLTSSCSDAPEKINLGKDMCDDCKMTISDDRFGAVLHTGKGRTYKFDDTSCLRNYMKNHADEKGEVYLVNYCEPHDLAPLKETMLWSSDDLQSPMNGNIAAFTNKDSINLYSQHFPGKNIDAQSLLQ